MKKIFACLLMLVSSIAFSQSGTDEAEVTKLVEELVASFNTHDFTTLKVNSTEDVSWVNITRKYLPEEHR